MHQDEAGSAVPTGVGTPVSALTFLFTDVEGSTPLWERHEATMRQVAARHDALLDGIITQYRGRRVKERGEGDSVFATFADPADAVAAALAIDRAVLAEPWPPETPIRVRMSLHTGTTQFREGDYYGPVVNRCARIRGLGHGGQVLLSSATASLVREALPGGATLRALGAHSLKGLSAPEEVFQLCHPDLPGEFPPLLSPQAPRHNLPEHLTGLIGRETEQGEVLSLLAAARLVTLVGAGGVGKTRLALAVAAELVDRYADGVWLVELAALAEPGLVVAAVAQALGVREEATRPLMDTLIDHLKSRQLLLLLDNCEHLVAACAGLAGRLARSCPTLSLLATSREALEVAGERRYRVPSLPVPDLALLPPAERLAESAAVALFVTRARERRSDFALTAQNGRAVASICARLDGIPLAIELAAARVGSLAVEGIAARLDDRFRLLTGGARDALPRQRTLRAALDWSYNLLGEPEQLVLDRLSVFAGGWTLAAAEAVCAGEGVEDWEVLDLLGGLVNRSLVQAADAGGELRYGLLETVRQYARERLAEAGGTEGARDRHLGWCLTLAEDAAPHLEGPEHDAWLARLEAEHDNLRAALAWAGERGAGEPGLRLAGALARFWDMRGYLGEGRGWLDAALATGEPAAPQARAGALSGAGHLALNQGDFARAAALYEEALALRRALGDRQGIATTLSSLGNVAFDQGQYERAAALQEESLALSRALGDRYGIADALTNLGNALAGQGDIEGAVALYEESLVLKRQLGDTYNIAGLLNNLGNAAYLRGDLAGAAVLYEESLALRRDLGDTWGIAMSLNNLGQVACLRGDHAQGGTLLREAVLVSHDIGARVLLAEGLEALAWAVVALGQPERAGRLGGAAEALREALGLPLQPEQRVGHDPAVQAMRAALGEAMFAAAWAEGRTLPFDQALSLAHADTPATV
jgi:predicted ATPase